MGFDIGFLPGAGTPAYPPASVAYIRSGRSPFARCTTLSHAPWLRLERLSTHVPADRYPSVHVRHTRRACTHRREIQ